MVNFILQTKLQSPQLKGKILRRERLLNPLKDNLDKKLILICADAGYGKTTLLAQFCAEFNKPHTFYDLDTSDNDIATFFNYIVSGIQRCYAKFGKRVMGIVSQTRNIEILVGTFINDFAEQIKDEFYVILDDYHHLQQNKEIGNALDYLLRHLPANLHLIISSRSTPPLNLAYYFAKQELFELKRKQLQFNLKEIEALLEEIYGLRVPDIEIERIEKHSEGWITAIHLILQKITATGEDKTKETLNGYITSGEEIFNYFAREVFEGQPQEIQEFLMRTAISENIVPEICNRLLNIGDSKEILTFLMYEHIFITKIDSDKYKYHPLFRDFLLNKLKNTCSQNKIRKLHQKAGHCYYLIKDYHYAVSHFLDALDFKRAATILAKSYAISPENYYLYLRLSNCIPHHILKQCPQILLKKIHILLKCGYYKEALGIAKIVQKQLGKIAKRQQKADFLEKMAFIYLVLMKPLRGLNYAKSALKLLTHKDRDLTIKVLITLADLYTDLNNYEDAEKLLNKAENFSKKMDSPFFEIEILRRRARLYGVTYNYRQEAEVYSHILEKLSKYLQPFQAALIYSNAALSFTELNELQKANNLLNSAFEISRQYNDRRAIAYSMGIYGRLESYRRNFEKAIKCYNEALILNQEFKEKFLDLCIMSDQIDAYLSMNNLKEARRFLRKLRENIDTEVASPILIGYLLMKGRVEGDENAFKKVLRTVKRLRLMYPDMLANYYYGEYYLNKGDIKSAGEHFNKSIEIARKENYGHFLFRAAQENLKNFEFCLQNEIENDFITEVLRKIESEDVRDLLAKTSSPVSHYELFIRLLGNVEMYNSRGKMVVPQWKGRKAKFLFIYLLINHNRKITRDELLDNFWPRLGSNEAISSLHANLSYIRQTLSDLLDYSSTSKELILYSRSCYQLNPRICIKCDTREFDFYFKKAVSLEKINKEKSIESCERALSLYRGEFCPDIYEIWSEDVRTYYKNQAGKIAKKLGDFYSENANYQKAIEFYNRAIEIDPIDEEGHTGLMQCFGRLGNKRAVVSQYAQLRQALKTKLKLNPSLKVNDIYQEILSKI